MDKVFVVMAVSIIVATCGRAEEARTLAWAALLVCVTICLAVWAVEILIWLIGGAV